MKKPFCDVSQWNTRDLYKLRSLPVVNGKKIGFLEHSSHDLHQIPGSDWDDSTYFSLTNIGEFREDKAHAVDV